MCQPEAVNALGLVSLLGSANGTHRTSRRENMGQSSTNRRRLIDSRPEAKAKQASKLAEIREALVAAGYDTAAKQAAALGVSRPTAWVVLNRDTRAGPSANGHQTHSFIAEPSAGSATKSRKYVKEKVAGLYGHTRIGFGGFTISSLRRNGTVRSGWAVIAGNE